MNNLNQNLLNKVTYLDVVEGVKQLQNEVSDVIICDPPYNIGKDFIQTKDKLPISDYVGWAEQWLDECLRTLKPDGTMYIYGFSEILAHLSVLVESKNYSVRWLIWHYTNKNTPHSSFWQRSHESILCVYKNKPIFNIDDVREPYSEAFLKNSAGKIRKQTPGRFSKGDKETVYNAHALGALPRDVIKVAALAGGQGAKERWALCKTCNEIVKPNDKKNHKEHELIQHPTQKPEELTTKLIKAAKHKNQSNSLILIPFAGSGAECVVSKKLKYTFIAFDNSIDYVNLANAWLNTI